MQQTCARFTMAGWLALVLLTACQVSPPPADPSSVLAIHERHGAGLRALMQRMERLTLEQELTGTRLALMRQRHNEQAQEDASAILANARALATLPPTSLDAEERGRFEDLAWQLGEQAEVIRLMAEFDPNVDLTSAWDSLEQTCDGCHRLYRPFGPGR